MIENYVDSMYGTKKDCQLICYSISLILIMQYRVTYFTKNESEDKNLI